MEAKFEAAGDVIVITGGGNGIGRGLAKAAAKAGARVVICDVDRAAMEAAKAEHPNISAVALDVSDRAAVFEVFGKIEKEHGKIDGLVCAAAIQPRTAVTDMPPEEWKRVIGINLDGVVWCYQAAIKGKIGRAHV